MAKKGISQIKGPKEIHLGETAHYEVSRIYDRDDFNKVKLAQWKLYIHERGNYRELKQKAGSLPKIGDKIPLKITNQKLLNKEILLEAFLYEPEKSAPPGLKIKVLAGKERKIDRVELFMNDDSPITKNTVLKYNQSIKVKVYTLNMPNTKLKLTLYEDDAQGKGHDKKNEKNKAKSFEKFTNKDGFLTHTFTLKADFKEIANAMMDGDSDKIHEYYILVEGANSNKASANVNVSNPDYIRKSKIEEVVITVKAKKQIGINPMPETGKSMTGVGAIKREEKKEEKVCECEARVRAFMRMLRFKEGTENEVGYTTQYSKKQFSDFSTHPQEVITDSKGKYSSSAAGAYQIMTDTWKNLTGYYKGDDKKWHYSEKLDYAKKYKITNFDQESQDKFCLVIMKHNYLQDRSDSFYSPTVWKNKEKKIHDTIKEEKLRDWRKRFKRQQGDIIQMIIDNDIKRAALISSLCWASLPDSPYGQQNSGYTFAIVKAIYEKNLREELIEPNKELHLKKGFLKEFGYGCCGNGEQKVELTKQDNTCPDDCSQCYEYEDVVSNPKINDQSGNRNHNRYKNEPRTRANGTIYYHSGTDILAKIGTEVHSMMCGEVVHIRKDLPQTDYIKGYESPSSYGNTVTIKSKDKDGKIVYHFYAHLSKVNIKVGETVHHNKVIGLSGSTGNAMHVEAKHRHVHVEAGTSYSTTGGNDGKQRCKINANLNPEKYMKSKFDNKGNTL